MDSRVIGCTGGIACGKTKVAQILEKKCGIPRIDADLLGHQAYLKGKFY